MVYYTYLYGSMFEHCILWILVQWHRVMKSSNGKNLTESNLTLK